MYYKCNSKCKSVLALIRFSDSFNLVVPKHFQIPPLISPPGYKPPPPPPSYKPTQNPLWSYISPGLLKWDFTVFSCCHWRQLAAFMPSGKLLWVTGWKVLVGSINPTSCLSAFVMIISLPRMHYEHKKIP